MEASINSMDLSSVHAEGASSLPSVSDGIDERDGKTSPDARRRALSGSLKDYVSNCGSGLTEKAEAFHLWQVERISHGWFPYGKHLVTRPAPTASLALPDGTLVEGLNFSSQDYLGLSKDRRVCDAARDAIDRYGVHSAGSAALAGNAPGAKELEQELSDFLRMPEVLLFPTGWAAGYGAVKGLVRDTDHVVIDALAHNCLHEGSRAATSSVHAFRHLDLEHAERTLRRIRVKDPRGGVLLVSETTFSMDADTPDILGLHRLARQYGALLLIDVAHDLGAIGPDGTGHLGLQGILGDVDLVVGSFSKTFASNGGFVASQKAAVKEYLRYYAAPNTFSNALSPVQVAIVRAALRIVKMPRRASSASPKQPKSGEALREALMAAVLALRRALAEAGLTALGRPAPIVPVLLGSDPIARVAANLISRRGVLSNLVEFPAVSANSARLRMQVMAGHSKRQCLDAATIIQSSVSDAADFVQALGIPFAH
jgi:7-keto-8-aminopelargonate synthetase-like enzyme